MYYDLYIFISENLWLLFFHINLVMFINFMNLIKIPTLLIFIYYYFIYALLEKAMAPTPLAWKIPWTEEPGRLQSMGSLRVGHD